jgi:hypothetical protein
MRTFYLADDDVRELVEGCRLGEGAVPSREFRALTSHHDEPLFANNVRAFYARFLATATLYEESLTIYREIDPKQVVDPATVLFYKAVCEHVLLERDAGLDTLHRLLDETANVPARYRAVGELMKGDLEGLKEKSLGEVARQMSDVRRRLDLGRAGEKVQRVEDQIIATLDEIIKQKEDQQNSSSSSSSRSPNGRMNPDQPKGADDTYLGGVKGQGLTEKKDIGRKDNWGELPPKSQAAAKNLLDRQFPGHYRQAVQEYLSGKDWNGRARAAGLGLVLVAGAGTDLPQSRFVRAGSAPRHRGAQPLVSGTPAEPDGVLRPSAGRFAR